MFLFFRFLLRRPPSKLDAPKNVMKSVSNFQIHPSSSSSPPLPPLCLGVLGVLGGIANFGESFRAKFPSGKVVPLLLAHADRHPSVLLSSVSNSEECLRTGRSRWEELIDTEDFQFDFQFRSDDHQGRLCKLVIELFFVGRWEFLLSRFSRRVVTAHKHFPRYTMRRRDGCEAKSGCQPHAGLGCLSNNCWLAFKRDFRKQLN